MFDRALRSSSGIFSSIKGGPTTTSEQCLGPLSVLSRSIGPLIGACTLSGSVGSLASGLMGGTNSASAG